MIRCSRVAVLGAGALVAAAACSDVPTSLLLSVRNADPAAAPDTVQLRVFDDEAVAYEATSFAVPGGARELGTVVIYPRATGRLALRVDGVGLRERAAVSHGVLAVTLRRDEQRTATLTLRPGPAPDGDHDGVPDEIDNCPSVANPLQQDADRDGRGDECSEGTAGDGGAPRVDGDAAGRPGGLLAPGAACAVNGECSSNFCVGGVCCSTECKEGCRACNLPSSRGLCMPVPAGQDPRDACAEQPGPTCGLDGTCDGTGVCRRHKLGTECGPPGCASEVDRILPSTCDGAGTCQIGEPRSCAPFTCLAGACRTTCASNAECAPGRSCNNGSCGPKPLGASCTTRDECNSGNCVQGVCCDVAECPAEATTSCGRTGRCDGGRCQKHAQNTVCGVRTCMGSTEFAPPVCDGRGMCVPTGTKSCSPYVCKGDGCATSCTGDTECLSSFYCLTNACRARRAIGSTCSEARECATNACVDGTCCTSVCGPNEYCAAGRVCANKRAIGTPCNFGYECVGNQCVDGLCCETTCTEVCRRCNDSAVTAGRCVPVPAGQTDTGCTGTRACDGAGNCRTR